MGPGIGVQRRSASAATHREEIVYTCEKFTITRKSKDRYQFSDAYMVTIRSSMELDVFLAGRVDDNKRASIDYALSRQSLRTTSSHNDAAPPAALVRKVQIEPTLRAVQAPAAPTKPAREPKRVARAPAKGAPMQRRAKVQKAEPAPPEAPFKDAVDILQRPKRRLGGRHYLKLLAEKAADAQKPDPELHDVPHKDVSDILQRTKRRNAGRHYLKLLAQAAAEEPQPTQLAAL